MQSGTSHVNTRMRREERFDSERSALTRRETKFLSKICLAFSLDKDFFFVCIKFCDCWFRRAVRVLRGFKLLSINLCTSNKSCERFWAISLQIHNICGNQIIKIRKITVSYFGNHSDYKLCGLWTDVVRPRTDDIFHGLVQQVSKMSRPRSDQTKV